MLAERLHAEDRGPRDGAPVVLAGSLGTTLRMWDGVAGELAAAGRRTVAYDQRGHGASPAPSGPYAIADLGRDALALLDDHGLERAAFVGLSLGGMVGAWLAAHEPGRVSALVLLCTAAHLPTARAFAQRAAAVRGAGTVAGVAGAVAARWLTEPYAAAHPDVAAGLRAMLAGQPAEGYAACCDAVAALDLRPDLAAIRAPTLVIGGAQDAAIGVEHQRALAQGIAGARLEILDPGAHIVAVERPVDVARLVIDHLEREEPAP